MKPLKSVKLNFILIVLLDVIVAALSFLLSNIIIFSKISKENAIYPTSYFNNIALIFIITIVVYLLAMSFFGMHKAIWKYAGNFELVKFSLAQTVTFTALFLIKAILQFAFNINYWASVILLFSLFSTVFSGVIRFATSFARFLKYFKRTHTSNNAELKRTLIIGAGYTGSLLVNRFLNNLHEGYLPVAILDDDEQKHGKTINGVSIVGGLKDIDLFVKKYKPEVFVIAILFLSKTELRQIYNACSKYKLPIKIAPQYTDAANTLNKKILSLSDINIESLLGRDEFKVNQDLIDFSIKDKVVMVTGGAGSIGSELCRQVLDFGCKHLIIFDQHENGMFFLNQEFIQKYDPSLYTLVIGTVRDKDRLLDVFNKYKPETVFHAAAYKHVPLMEFSATEAIKNNVMGTQNVIDCAEKVGVKKFVLISTDKAVNPSNVMGASKRLAEMVIETRGKTSQMKMAAVRFGNVLGSNGSVIPIFLDQIKKGGPITLTDRYIKRYFMSIPEAVRLVLQTGAFADNGEIFVLDMGEPVYIYDLACDLIKLNGLEPEKDIEIRITGLRPGEKMFEELRYDNESVNTTIHKGVFVNKMEDIEIDKFNNQLETLSKFALLGNEEETVNTIFSIVSSKYRK